MTLQVSAEVYLFYQLTQHQPYSTLFPYTTLFRSHHDAEKHHRRNRANPIPVRGKNAVLIGGTRPAQQLERAKVRRDESQAGDPRGHLAAGQKEIFAGLCESLQIKADSQNQKEIESDDDKVDFG